MYQIKTLKNEKMLYLVKKNPGFKMNFQFVMYMFMITNALLIICNIHVLYIHTQKEFQNNSADKMQRNVSLKRVCVYVCV